MKLFYKYAAIAFWMLLIFLLSHEPAGASSSRSDLLVNSVLQYVNLPEDLLTFIIRKSAHVFIYFVLGLLVYNAVQSHSFSNKRAVLISIAIALGYASLDEWHQSFVPGRSGEVSDILIDTIGAAIGIGCYYATQVLQQRQIHKSTSPD